jgi:hypothetical protein
MTYDPRTIAFLAEVIHPPSQVRADLVQTVHNQLFRQPAVGYQNFQVAPDGIHLTNVPMAPGQISTCTFAWDRIVLREELRGITVEDFATRTVNVLSVAFQHLGIGTALAQQFVVRSLITPRHARDGRELLSERMLAANGPAWQAFGRPIQSLGLRVTFPPAPPAVEMFHLRIETWPQDQRSLWVENTGSFGTPLAVENLPQVANYLYATYRFLTGPVGEFLAHFDHP